MAVTGATHHTSGLGGNRRARRRLVAPPARRAVVAVQRLVAPVLHHRAVRDEPDRGALVLPPVPQPAVVAVGLAVGVLPAAPDARARRRSPRGGRRSARASQHHIPPPRRDVQPHPSSVVGTHWRCITIRRPRSLTAGPAYLPGRADIAWPWADERVAVGLRVAAGRVDAVEEDRDRHGVAFPRRSTYGRRSSCSAQPPPRPAVALLFDRDAVGRAQPPVRALRHPRRSALGARVGHSDARLPQHRGGVRRASLAHASHRSRLVAFVGVPSAAADRGPMSLARRPRRAGQDGSPRPHRHDRPTRLAEYHHERHQLRVLVVGRHHHVGVVGGVRREHVGDVAAVEEHLERATLPPVAADDRDRVGTRRGRRGALDRNLVGVG